MALAPAGNNTGRLYLHYIPRRRTYVGSYGRDWGATFSSTYAMNKDGFVFSNAVSYGCTTGAGNSDTTAPSQAVSLLLIAS